MIRSSRYHHGDLRRALLDAALEKLADEGPQALSLRGLARHVGVSQTAVYRHFDSKTALLAALAGEGFDALRRETLSAADEAGEEPLARLRAIGLGYVRFARANPAYYRLMFGPHLRSREAYPRLMESARASYGVLEEGVERGVRAGVLVNEPVPLLSKTAWSLVHGLSLLLIDGLITPESEGEALVESVIARLGAGLESSS